MEPGRKALGAVKLLKFDIEHFRIVFYKIL